MHFRCLENCALCCSYKVALLPADIKRIVEKGYRENEFTDNGFLLKKNGYCVFLGEDLKCTIYNDRPAYCRSFPFYVEEDGIDIDLSCPGAGRSGKLQVESYPLSGAREVYFEILKKSQWYVSRSEFKKRGSELHNCLSNIKSQTFPQHEVFHDFFNIVGGRGIHFASQGKLTKYEFELDDSTFRIENCDYQLAENFSASSFSEVEQQIILDYIKTWFGRSIFYRFCLISSAGIPAPQSPSAVAFAFIAELTAKISMIKDALSIHWKKKESSADCEEMWREAIRVMDGRLRTKCQSVHISQ